MGKNSGNTYGTAKGGTIAVNTNGRKLTAKQVAKAKATAEGLDSLPHREVTKQLRRAISRYEKVMGVRERDVKVAELNGAYGATFISPTGSHGVILSKKVFSQHRNAIEASYKKSNYETGFKNLTNRPIQHTRTHELAHATWTSSYASAKHKAAGKDIKALYKRWLGDKKKKGYGTYGKSNVDEFWAEVVTKGIHGKSDKYTKRAINIARRYKL